MYLGYKLKVVVRDIGVWYIECSYKIRFLNEQKKECIKNWFQCTY